MDLDSEDMFIRWVQRMGQKGGLRGWSKRVLGLLLLAPFAIEAGMSSLARNLLASSGGRGCGNASESELEDV